MDDVERLSLRADRSATVVVVLTILGALGSAGCASARAKNPNVAAALEASDALIQLRRRGCEAGVCPVYGIAVFANGDAIYVGGANVAVTGRRNVRLAAGDVSALLDSFEKIDFIDTPEHCCDCPSASNNPKAAQITIDYRPGGVEKEVIVDERCASLPASVTALESKIEATTKIGRWIERGP